MKKYIDEHGQVWKRYQHDPLYVYKASDGTVGGWFNGEGLEMI